MSKSITIEELNKRIDALISDYNKELNVGAMQNSLSPVAQSNLSGKIEALEDLKIDLNDPEAVEDITENVQQTLNVIETKKIIGDDL